MMNTYDDETGHEDLPFDPFSNDCISRDLFDTIGDKWAMLILLSLEQQPLRNGEIKNRVDAISPKVLTQRLKVLVDDGLLTRTAHSEVPPRVEYELTALGRSLVKPVQQIYFWTVDNMDAVLEARKSQPSR